MMEAIILAGGLGKRLREVTGDKPKCMVPIHGRPFLEYLLDYWSAQGVGRFILAVGYRHEVIREHFGDRYGSVAIDYSVEMSPLGTGGGLFLALQNFMPAEPFLVLNGDTFFKVSLDRMRRFHRERQSEATLALFKEASAGRYEGIGLGPDGEIRSFTARGEAELSDGYNGGVYLLEPDVLKGILPEGPASVSLEREVFPGMLESGRRCFGLVSENLFIDIGTPEDYEKSFKVIES